MSKWVIPAPEWVGNHLQQIGNVLAALHGPYADPTPWYVAYDNAKHWFYTEPEARAWVEARVMEAMGATVAPDGTGFGGLIADAIIEADKAMLKFPQPNYVISKIAEEAGEVVKAAIHCAEGRETAENLAGEMKQCIAMLYRLWVEGDQVHGLPPVASALKRKGND